MTKKWIAGGLGLGTALMYLLDPAFGRRRRAILRDKLLLAPPTGRATRSGRRVVISPTAHAALWRKRGLSSPRARSRIGCWRRGFARGSAGSFPIRVRSRWKPDRVS